jgi:hypothetical protein
MPLPFFKQLRNELDGMMIITIDGVGFSFVLLVLQYCEYEYRENKRSCTLLQLSCGTNILDEDECIRTCHTCPRST